MDWTRLAATTHVGDPSAPLVIALHGFGQNVDDPVHWWRRGPMWKFWNFPAMSGILHECRKRRWGCYMPQAPQRNWRPRHAADKPSEAGSFASSAPWTIGNRLRQAARAATKSSGPPHIVGFSDGATLVNRFLLGGADFRSFVSYSGVFPQVEESHNLFRRALVVWNIGEAEAIKNQSSVLANRLDELGVEHDLMLSPGTRHEWTAEVTTDIFDWMDK